MPSIVFMGTPEWAVPSLRAVADFPGAALVGVFSQAAKPAGRHRQVRPSAIQAAAESLGVPVVTPTKAGDAGAMAALDAWRPDLIVVCAYGRILPTRVLDHPPLGCFNLHFSLLPRWRGASPVQAAILAGDPVTGVSLQRMVRELDAGAIAAETAPMPIAPEDTAETLGLRLADASARLIGETLPVLLAGNPPLRGQDPASVTHCGIVPKQAGAVHWDRDDAARIARQHRAYTPWPGCYGFLAGKRLEFTRMEAGEPPPDIRAAAQDAEPGTLLAGGWVPARDGFVRLVEVKPEGKRAMPLADFLRGQPRAVGQRITPEPAGQPP
jgi:methionyl-tRNA formyltransferase